MLSRALLLALLAPVSALQLAASVLMGSPTYASTGAASAVRMADGQDPLLLRAARGEEVERSPVWMMRQAGRHMQVYRDLVKDYPTFRERSEIPDVSFEVSMQPYRAYKTDGVILFSDILTRVSVCALNCRVGYVVRIFFWQELVRLITPTG